MSAVAERSRIAAVVDASASQAAGPVSNARPTQAEAEEFRKDHQGRRIVRFDEVTLELLENLDRGKFQ